MRKRARVADNVGGRIQIRLDSLIGPVIGEATVGLPGGPADTPVDADAAPPAAGRSSGPKPVVVTLKPTTGVHDLYFIFKNEKASGGQLLMSVSQLILQ